MQRKSTSSAKVFNAIKKDEKGSYKSLQSAVKKKQWERALILIDEAMKTESVNNDFIPQAGMALLLAAKENQETIVKALFLLAKKFYQYNDDEILFKPLTSLDSPLSRPTHLWTDKRKYTPLHWAVIKNNSAICRLIVAFTNELHPSHYKYGENHEIYRAKDSRGLNALTLAFGLGHLDCAKEIAKGMFISSMLEHSSDEVIYKILLNDARFEFRYTENSNRSKDFFQWMTFQSSDGVGEKIKLVLQYIFSLPIEDKKKWINAASDNKTTFGELIERSSEKEKYQRLMARELIEISQNELTAVIEKQLLEKKDSALSFETVDSECETKCATKKVPFYSRTTNLYARSSNVPLHSLETDSRSSCEDDERALQNIP